MSEPTLTLITAEHHQALEEIKLRIEHDDDWFHIKFLLIGGLSHDIWDSSRPRKIEIGRWRKEHASATSNLTQLGFEEMLGNPIASTIFAVVFIVAVIIDMHVRTSYMVVHQLANWILTHVDPILNCRKSIFSSYCETTPYLPWEGFLRLSDHGLKGMHEDFLWNLFQTPHFHFTTWVLYISYLLMFFWLYTYGSIGGSSDGRFGKLATTILLLAIAHVVLGIFAFLGHTAPGAFDEKVLAPGVELWISSDKAGSMFAIVWLVMTGLAALRVSSIIPGRQQCYAMLSSKWDLLPFRRWLLRRQCKRGGAPAADSHGPARRLLIVVTRMLVGIL